MVWMEKTDLWGWVGGLPLPPYGAVWFKDMEIYYLYFIIYGRREVRIADQKA